jgi:hypothetical protein
LSSRMRYSSASKLLPKKLWLTITSGSWRCIVARSELSSARSALTVWKGGRSDFARVSRFAGNFSIGRTMVLRDEGKRSGGVGSSILPDCQLSVRA